MASLRTVLPMALVTCTSMLTMDLYLPAIPSLQQGLRLSVEQGQATVAVFLLGLALSQLLWGAALHRFGPRRCVTGGIVALLATTLGCALADSGPMLLAMRLAQGLAAGAATVVAPTVIRATLPEKDGVRGIAAIAMVEAIVPAAGPVAGTALLLFTDWRGTFWTIALLTLITMPFAIRASPARLPGHDTEAAIGYLHLLRDSRYVRVASCHALGFGALITFVASAPQLLAQAFGRGPEAFAFIQVLGVGAFIALATQAGRISERIGAPRAIQLGAWLHVGLCAALLAAAALSVLDFAWTVAFWVAFCAALAVRGPAAFSEALAVPAPQMGRASALLVLALLAAGAAGTQTAAALLEGSGTLAVASVMLTLTLASAALVARYPKSPELNRSRPGSGPRSWRCTRHDRPG